MSATVVLMGVLAVGVGWVVTQGALQKARRRHHRMTTLPIETGWDDWFLGGFSGLALGIRWLTAGAVGLVWALAGAWIIGLGLRLFSR